MRFAYNTNGFAHHDLLDAIDVIADLGYEGVALTLDVHHLHPLRATPREVEAVAARLARGRLRATVETGARYILDPRRKHEPSLVSPDAAGRARRVEFLRAAIDIAADLGAEAVALFSGRLGPGDSAEAAWERLSGSMAALLDHAATRRATLAFEPEPGHLVADLAGYERLRARVGARLRLTLDLGHVRCSETMSIPEAIARHAADIANVHVEDIRDRVHEHLAFGDGEIDFPPALAALERSGYRGLVSVELSRHSHDAPEQARRSIAFLRNALEDGRQSWP